jgi:dethiobiotin synthetase
VAVNDRSNGIFVVGTDTGVGKTAVAVVILRQLVAEGRAVGAYKPVASGIAERSADDEACSGDPDALWRAAGRPLSPREVCPQAFAAAIAPAAAALAEGKKVDEMLLRQGLAVWTARSECVVVEGAGGLFSPLADRTLNVDLAREFGYPLVVVDSGRLGAIGRVLAMVRAATAEGLRVAAVVISHVSPLDEAARDDPESGWSIAEAAREDLARRLTPLPVLRLRHAAARIEPATDWIGLG